MDVQQIITLGIVAVAAVSLGRKLWKSAQGEGCDGCAGACGKPVTNKHTGRGLVRAPRPMPQATPLVTLGMRPKR